MNTISSIKYLKANKIGVTFIGTYPIGSTMVKFKLADNSVNLYPYQKITFEIGDIKITGNYNEDYSGTKYLYLDSETTIEINGLTEGIFWYTSGQNSDNELMLKGDILKNIVGESENKKFEAKFNEFSEDIYNLQYKENGIPHLIDGLTRYKLNRLFTKVYKRIVIEESNFVTIGKIKVTNPDETNPNYYKSTFELRISKTNNCFAKFIVDFDIFETIDNPNSHFSVTNLYQDITDKIYLQFNFIKSKNSKNNYINYIEVKLRGKDLNQTDIEFSVLNKSDMYIPSDYQTEENNQITFIGKNEIEFYEGIIGYNTKHCFALTLFGDSELKPKKINPNTDLNTITSSGYYYCYEDYQTILNFPKDEQFLPFNLRIINFGNGIFQELTILSNSKLNSWRRYYNNNNNNTWSNWNTLAKIQHIHVPADINFDNSGLGFITDEEKEKLANLEQNITSLSWLKPSTNLNNEPKVKGNVVYNLNDNSIYKCIGNQYIPIDIQNLCIDGDNSRKLSNDFTAGYLISKQKLDELSIASLSKQITTSNGIGYIHSQSIVENYLIANESIDLVKRNEGYFVGNNVVIIGQNIINDTKSFNDNTIIIGNNINANEGIKIGTGLIGFNVVFGNYNLNIESTLFNFGIGRSDTERDSAIYVDDFGYSYVKGLKIFSTDNGEITFPSESVILSTGGIHPLSDFILRPEFEEFKKETVKKGNILRINLISDDDDQLVKFVICDTDSRIVVTPIGEIAVDANGNVNFYGDNIRIDTDNTTITILAAISSTSEDQNIEVIWNEETGGYDIIDISSKYNHTSEPYLTTIDFNKFEFGFSNGQKTIWFSKD